MAAKPTNPKDALGIRKAPFSTVPCGVIAEVGIGMLEGALKYGRHNYRVMGVRGSVYFDAAMRHLTAWWEGEDIDPDSELSHITKAICSLVVLRDAMIRANWADDRPPPSLPGWLDGLNGKVVKLLAKYPEQVAPYVRIESPRECGEARGRHRCVICGVPSDGPYCSVHILTESARAGLPDNPP